MVIHVEQLQKKMFYTRFLYNVYKKNTGEVSKYNITLAKKTYLKLPSNLENSLQRTQW